MRMACFLKYGRVCTPSSKGAGLIEMPQNTGVAVKNMVLFWVPIIIRHLIFRVPKKGL